MNEVNVLRKEVKKYIDTADERVVKMVYAMLEADHETDFWDYLPDTVKKDVDEALQQSAKGLGKPHKEVMKKYKKWRIK